MAGVLGIFRRWLRNDKDRNFISGIKRQQEADLGLSRSEIADFAAMPSDTRAKMEAMAQVFGLSPDRISSERWRELEIARACGHCGSRRECARALRAGATMEDAKRFCPNFRNYLDLKTQSQH